MNRKPVPYLDFCPECGNDSKKSLFNTPLWFECKECLYCEDIYKGPILSPMQEIVKVLV